MIGNRFASINDIIGAQFVVLQCPDHDVSSSVTKVFSNYLQSVIVSIKVLKNGQHYARLPNLETVEGCSISYGCTW